MCQRKMEPTTASCSYKGWHDHASKVGSLGHWISCWQGSYQWWQTSLQLGGFHSANSSVTSHAAQHRLRLPRLRCLFLILEQFHSQFVGHLICGYRHGDGGTENPPSRDQVLAVLVSKQTFVQSLKMLTSLKPGRCITDKSSRTSNSGAPRMNQSFSINEAHYFAFELATDEPFLNHEPTIHQPLQLK